MNRRSFLKATAGLGGTALISLLVDGCGRATPAPPEPAATPAAVASPQATTTAELPVRPSPTAIVTPSVERRSPMAQVAFVKTQDRAAGVDRALALLEMGSMAGKDLFLKPNFNSADAPPGSTHDDTLSALVRALSGMGAGRITVGDRSGMGDTRRVMEQKGVFRMAEELGFETIVFDELDASSWEMMQIEGSHWQRGFAVARPVLEADGVVQTCCLKTHRFGGHFTLSLKNSVGLVAKWVPGDDYNYMSELHGSPHQRRMIAEVNAAYQPDLILLDGVEAFVDGGPDRGTQVDAQVILAGTDRVAIDAVGVAILRYFGTTPDVSRGPIFQQQQIARAVELGLGVGTPEEIELVTGDPDSETYAAEIREILMQG
ncbi:MAG TPA: DUF362 domain-containing protein [Anaerolineae bacterium]|nr:DUF362 domain-containing protein [Anaerolineae bacterium]